ncbi:acyl-CoA carboxylase epsilon subunit [Streptomyces lonarensis]|uniref:Acyl-CoA carboxylase subunit epsilon n=1 Tax=Streptomyces lonarensis TaxID=700599 RepID=A0A7X6D1H4_9ACTN|nr:acyl-CoA carboxylase epsilon subunit [Streptomyces lonarensis]NJQ06486.1 acyl-CoA carboxylase subunit epsilon [Streptomyces lonarensis]
MDGQPTREGGAEPETIRVVRGNPTPEELAAALAVVRARLAAAPAGADGPVAVSAWGAPSLTVPGSTPAPGPDTWRTSHWPI